MELVYGLDVGENGGHCLGGEECTRSVLLVHSEVKHLKNIDFLKIKYLLRINLTYNTEMLM